MKTTAIAKCAALVGSILFAGVAANAAGLDVKCKEATTPNQVYSVSQATAGQGAAAHDLKFAGTACQVKVGKNGPKFAVKPSQYLHASFDCGADIKAKLDLVKEKSGAASRGTVFFRTSGDEEQSEIKGAIALDCTGL